jgi:hypothetical protein
MKVRNLIIILLVFLTTTCSQAPIFYIISNETAPTKPRIEGAPTNMVIFKWGGKDVMLVASGRLHWYAKIDDPNNLGEFISRWDSGEFGIPQPKGKITSLAVTPTRLYALCIDDQGINATLRYIKSDESAWTTISSVASYPLQSIYADPEKEQLFVGARRSNSNSFAIYYLNSTDKLVQLKDGTALLSGAVHKTGNYFLCTRGEFFQVKDDLTDIQQLSENKIVFMGIIKLKDESIVAVARDKGTLYEANNDSLVKMEYANNGGTIETGKYAMGSFGLWEGPIDSLPLGTTKKLIVGIQGGLSTGYYSTTSYSHGYVEFELNSNGSFNTAIQRRDSGRLESAGNNDQYASSLGKHPINHLFQAPDSIDEKRTFFASTQTGGLWSFRDRPSNGGWQWNAEE